MFAEFHNVGAQFGFCFTDRLGGVSTGSLESFNLGKTDQDELNALQQNMALLREQIGVESVVAVHQIHSNIVFDVDQDRRSWDGNEWLGDRTGQALPQADAIITSRPKLALMIRVADCVPVLFAAGNTVAAAHAGRAGLISGVLTETIAEIRKRTQEPIKAWIGPHICGSCYELPAEMVDEIGQQFPQAVSKTSWGTPAIDLGIAAETQITAAGVECRRYQYCTRTDDRFFSHRGDGPKTGRQAGLIWAWSNENGESSS